LSVNPVAGALDHHERRRNLGDLAEQHGPSTYLGHALI
jgi:hypothetical protein